MTTSRDTSGIARVESARAIADAVLFEGYMLYPYRANDAKNHVRWQFGVLAPPAFARIDPSEHAFLRTECLLDGGDDATVEILVQARFLQAQRRTVERRSGDGFVTADSIEGVDATYLPWDEAVPHEPATCFSLAGGTLVSSVDLHIPGGTNVELLRSADRDVIGRLVRRREPLDARLSIEVEPLPGPYGVRRLRLRLENRTAWPPRTAVGDASAASARTRTDASTRPDALRRSLLAAHLLIAVEGSAFISLIDPPQWASAYAESCVQAGVFPVLAGPVGTRDLILASPIILYDHPQVAPESTSQFCDATEMDEMLTLRTLTLTDDELRLARGSDPRAAALVDQIDNLPGALLQRLHGAIRSMSSVARPTASPAEAAKNVCADGPNDAVPWWNSAADSAVDPDTDIVLVEGVPLARGSEVRLRPGRRADAQDMFLDGRRARVEAVLSDVDGGCHLAVTLEDLASHGQNPHGRFLYFAPDEVEPITTGESCAP